MNRQAFLSMAVVLGLGLLLGFVVVGSPLSPVSLAAPADTPLFVKSGAGGDCSTWENACDLQHALIVVASPGDQIWVAAGTYYPGSARSDTFQLVSGVAVYGGFAGTESELSQRNPDPATNGTILSGDIGTPGNSGDNSYHVVTGSGITETAVLDGFTITGGNADPYPNYRGGGMYNDGGSPTLRNLTLTGNFAYYQGGGMYNTGSSPALTDVIFSGCHADGMGGGMSNIGSSPVLTGVIFSNNTAELGGGMYNQDNSSPALTDVTFGGNSAETFGGTYSRDGGGMYNLNSSPTLTRVIFNSNSAQGDGGGMSNGGGSRPTLLNVTFSGNSAAWGGGISNDGSDPMLTHVILSGNSASNKGGGMANFYYSRPVLTDVSFSDNTAMSGGGMYSLQYSSPVLTGVAFNGNSATNGGAMSNEYHSTPVLTNVAFNGNSASQDGGGMYSYQYSSPELTNVTLSSNIAAFSGGAMYNGLLSTPVLTNCILWGNTAENTGNQIYNSQQSHSAVSYSDIQGGCGSIPDNDCGTGNIDADPLFAREPDPGDGLWSTPLDNDYGDLHLRLGSPAVDAGDNASLPPGVSTDLDGFPRIANGRVDMGAYEASLVLIKSVDDASPLPGDLILFSIVAENAYTETQFSGGMISDTLSAGLTFAGPITLEPPGAGTAGTAPPVLVSALTINPGQRITVTVPVTVHADLPAVAVLANTAVLSSTELAKPLRSRVTVRIAGIIYVDDSASGAADGTSWTDAYTDLQDALSVAYTGDEIWVAAGSYKPGSSREATFRMKSGVAIYGGFAGGETSRAQRNWVANPTALSGDIGVGGDTSDNVYHVVTGSGVTETAMLDGFAISGGNASGSDPDDRGGGMVNKGGSPTLSNVVFSGNTAESCGGGMANVNGGNPALTNVTFSGNTVQSYGGGMCNLQLANPTLTNVTFSGNDADIGGGMYNDGSDPIIQNSVLWGNTAASGPQIWNASSAPTIRYTDIQGGCPTGAACEHVLAADPLFVAAAGGDFRLSAGSPAVDGGDNAALPSDAFDLDGDGNTIEKLPFDLDGDRRIVNGTVDMGVYEADYNLVLTKTVDDPIPYPGQEITYRIYVASSGAVTATGTFISDTLPAGLTFAGPITLDPPGAGTVGVAPPALVSELTIDPGQRITVSVPVTVDADLPPITVINTAVLSGTDLPRSLSSSVAFDIVGTLYVDDSATGEADGTSWTDAYTDLQDALSAAGRGDEIWVAAGVYKPTTDAGDRSAAFQMKSEVALYGGFAGTPGSEGDFGARDWKTYVTVLSGDIDDNDGTDANGVITSTAHISGTNSYHVVTGSGVTETAVLDGFTLTGGKAGPQGGGGMYTSGGSPTLANVTFSGNTAQYGGGMHNYGGNPTLIDVTFSGNSAEGWGGGMYTSDGSPTLTGVTFSGNSAEGGSGGPPHRWGGGMINFGGSPTLTDVTFSSNSARDWGGGMCTSGGSPTLANVTFSGNTASVGGGMYHANSSMTLANATFSGNSAVGGGGMYNEGSSPNLANVTFSGNTASVGGGMFNSISNPTLTNLTFSGNEAGDSGGAMYNYYGNPVIANSILWGNSGGTAGSQIQNVNSTPAISDTIVQGGCPPAATCEDVLDAEPLFVRDPDPGDGQWSTPGDNDYGDLHLRFDSPAIDAGDNAALPPDALDLDADGDTGEPLPLDLEGNPRVVHDRVDMGAFEFAWLFSKTVDRPMPSPGERVIFYLVVENAHATTALTGAMISDTLPAGLTFAGPITLDPPDAGTVGTAPPVLASDLTINPGQGVRVALPVTVDVGLPVATVITNMAVLSGREIAQPLSSSTTIDIAEIIYVDDSAGGADDGTSWTDAFTDLQDALSAAGRGDQVWVAAGVYKPGSSPGATFQMRSGAALYGGFEGTESSLEERDWATHVSVLSGDIDNNDLTDLSGVITDTTHISGANSYHVVTGSGTDATALLDGFTVTGGYADGSGDDDCGGGLTSKDGSFTAINVTFRGNLAATGGGLCSEGGSPTLYAVTVRDNRATDGGGGVYQHDGEFTVEKSTLANNAAAGPGGGLSTQYGALTVINTTFSGNDAGTLGGGVYVYSGTIRLNSASLISNTATTGGSIVLDLGGSSALANTILADAGGGNCGGEPITSLGYNLSSDGTCPMTNTGDISNTMPLAGPLADNGGDTETHALLAGSPAIDAGSPAVPGSATAHACGATDQRGVTRPQGLFCDIGAYEAPSSLQPPACAARRESNQAVYSSEDASALQQAVSGAPAGDTIKVAGTCSGVQSLGAGVQTLYIDKSLTIQGGHRYGDWDSANPLADPTTLDAGSLGRVVLVASGHTVILQDLNLANGFDATDGGGVYNAGSTLTLERCTVRGSLAEGNGGGIHNAGGSLTLDHSTIYGNAAGNGGGIYHSAGALQIDGSTLYANAAAALGGGLYNQAEAEMVNSTLSGNLAHMGGAVYNGSAGMTIRNSTFHQNEAQDSGGAVHNSGGTVSVEDTILANSVGGDNCSGDPLSSGGYNLSGDASCSLTGTGDLNETDPLLGPLGSYGGATPTHALLAGSPAIDAGNCSGGVVLVDQRGVTRPQRTACDIGAHEALPPPPVGTCVARVESSSAAFGSVDAQALRDAVAAASPGGVIRVAGTCQGVTGGDNEQDGNVVVLDKSLTLRGGYSTDLTSYDPATYPTMLDAQGGGRVLDITSGKVVLEDLILTNGHVVGGLDSTGADGGGIRNRGDLTLRRVRVSGNKASDASLPLFMYGYGGGIFNDGAPLNLTDSVVAGNEADSSGGGIHNTNGGSLWMQSSAIEDNQASDFGGGLNLTKMSSAIVISSTIQNNLIDAIVASYGGGISNFTGMLLLQGSAVLSNTVDTTAAAYGGGINCNLGFTMIENSTVSGNRLESTTLGAAGGGINVAGGGLSLTGSEVKGNQVSALLMASGGGINATLMASVVIQDSSIEANAAGDGGGLDNDTSVVEIDRTTFADNQATAQLGMGGAIRNQSRSEITIRNSTFSGNRALGLDAHGGAIGQENGEIEESTVTIRNSTIASNAAGLGGGGIYNYSVVPGRARIDVQDTILADNQSTALGASNCFNQFGNIDSQGHNLTDDGTCSGFDAAGDITNHPDAGLAPLVDTGQGILVRPLRYDSPAVDHGSCSGGLITIDQRGITRPVGAACDIGAVERANTPPIPADDAYAVELSGTLEVNPPGVLANDVDLQADPMVARLVDDVAHGELAFNADGSFVYVAGPDFNGMDTFTYVADDPEDPGVLSGTVLIRVGPFIVTEGGDELELPLDVDGNCSLREAIMAANTNLAVDRCGPGFPGQDTILLPAGTYALALAGAGEDGNTSGDLDILEDLIIEGGGQGATMIDGSSLDRVLHIPNAQPMVELSDLTVTGGSSDGDGGAIYNRGTLTVTDSTVSYSSAAAKGGGIYHDGSARTALSNVVVVGNTAASGGGMYNPPSSDPRLSGVIFEANAAVDGGGLYSDGGSPELVFVDFVGNTATGDGGGLYSDGGSPELTSVTFVSNTATGNGGGMYNWESDPSLTGVAFDDNSAGARGGGLCNGESNVTLESVTLVGNVAQDSGGGMYNQDSSATLTGVTFRDNRAVGGEGGGMVNYTFILSPVQTIEDALFSGNSAGTRGGGMANTESSPTLTDVTFDDNYAGGGGGGMHNVYGSNPELHNVTFSNNSAEDYGGGMSNFSNSNPELHRVTFSGNSAYGGDGGGMYNSGSSPDLTNVLFAGNSADEGGGMRNHDASNPVLTNVTFAGNAAFSDGGGILNYESDPILQNSILWGNTAEHEGSQVFNFFSNDNPVIIATIVQGGCPEFAACVHVLDADPLFVRNPDPGDGLWITAGNNDYGDLHLRLGSPAIDAGDNAALPPGVTTDLDGNPRIANGRVDMGAYEAGLVLVKSVDDATPRPGDPILFTIVAENAYTDIQISGGVISDTIPGGLTFVGPITLDPPGAGTVGTAPPVLASDLTIAPGQRVTVTLPAMIDGDASGGTYYNTASLTSAEVPGPLRSGIALYVSSEIIYVDDSATGAGHGGSWADACTDLQDALAIATGENQIWVAEGIYLPTYRTEPGNPRTATFQLRSGVEIYGGFPDGGGSFVDRDWIANPTVLSGDLDGNDVTGPNGILTSTAGIAGDNAYHVVTGSGTDASARLDGFTITGGKTREPLSDHRGAGMYNDGGSPTLVNLRFVANSAYQCGGMHNDNGIPTLINVAFHGNTAEYDGGGMCSWSPGAKLFNVAFSGNVASERGGGMVNYLLAESLLVNVTFYGNSAGDLGGGMYNASWPTITNTILWGNTATNDGAEMYNWRPDPPIIWPDTVVASSLVKGGCPDHADCSDLLTDDPLFVEAAGPDGIPGTPDDDLRLQIGSPAIDAGDNSYLPSDTYDLDHDGDTGELIPFDLDGNPRIVNDRVDMGALEYVGGIALFLTKMVDEPMPSAGGRITYTIVARNASSDTAVTGGLISDTLPPGLIFAGPITLDPPGAGVVGTAPPVLASELTLDPGGRVTVTLPVTVDGGLPGNTVIANTASMTCAEVTTPLLSTVDITVAAEPAIRVVKIASVSQAQVGETITYTYWVTNTGNVTLDEVNAVDDPLGSVNLGTTSLAPGQGTSGTLSYTVQGGDLPGPLSNIVTASGQPPVGPWVTAEASATVSLVEAWFKIYLPLVMR